jgi:hypothetical protein
MRNAIDLHHERASIDDLFDELFGGWLQGN